MYNVIKGGTVKYDGNTPFIIETVIEDKSAELTDEQNAIVNSEINRRLKEIERNADAIAGEIIKRAQDEAELMLEQARFESAAIYEAKRKEGLLSGTQEAVDKYTVILENSEALIENEKRRFESEISKLSNDVLDLSIAMAEKITTIEFARNDMAILSALERIIEKYKKEKKIIVEVSAENLERLKETELAQKYEIRENKVLGEKDALVELESGIIDISMDKQLENLANSMKD